jgi:DNA-binding transcriptional LysR family regulator
METNRLHQFITLYKVGNLRKAAELLGISHSGLSKSMNALAGDLDQELYLQQGRGIIFTDEAHILAKKIPTILSSIDELTSSLEYSDKQILRIGSFEVFTTYFSKKLSPLFSDYDLDFHELVPGKMENALVNRDIDIAITYEPIPIPGVEHLKVAEIEMAAYTKKGSFKGQSIQQIPFAAPLIPVEGAPTGIKGLDSWPDHKFKREIKFRVDLMETALSLTRNGHCAIFLPSFVAKLHNEQVKEEYNLVKRTLPPKMKSVKRTVYIIKRESTVEDSKIKKIAKFLRALA